MTELKFEKIMENGIEFRYNNFLLAEEVMSIVEQMENYDNYMAREIVKGVLLIKFCTNIPTENMEDLQLYNMYVANGIINFLEENIININSIDKNIEYNNSVAKSVNTFLTNAFTLLEKVEKKIPTKKALDGIVVEFQNAVKKYANIKK
ncbi:MAG: hypothetical protein RSD67_05305 [Oscillospiraceae bacterium]